VETSDKPPPPSKEEKKVVDEENPDLKFFLAKSNRKKGCKTEVVGGGIKLEEGLIKYEYSNQFSLRVINHMYGYKQSLESYINQQRVKAM